MLEQEVRVTFTVARTDDAGRAVGGSRSGKTVYVLRGTQLLEAAASAGIMLDSPCGGKGICGKCRTIVRIGASGSTTEDERVFTEEELGQGLRLGCQTAIDSSMTVEIPETSLLTSQHKILAQLQNKSEIKVDPAIRKQYVKLSVPGRGDDVDDVMRLQKVAGLVEVDLDLVRRLPKQLRQNEFKGTAVIVGGFLVDLEVGNTEEESFGVVVDLGTTTLVAMLLDLNSGEDLATVTRLNPQTNCGDDVVSRIQYAREDPQGLNELHETIVAAINEMVDELIEQAGVSRSRIYEIVVSGNTTMQQLLCRIDTSSLGEVPFVAATGRSQVIQASRLSFAIHPRGHAYIMPVIGGFVGGDTVSGILATGLANPEGNRTNDVGPSLLVDIGTNGEVVLAFDHRLWAAATAAGPAFEGARIMCGMRGSIGAIEKVIFEDTLRTNVIGNVPPVGLCGSALIDIAAELLRYGVLAPEGRLKSAKELTDQVPADLRSRVVDRNGSPAVLLVASSQSGTGEDIVVTQRDFRELQLASGAIRAGILLLLKRAGLSVSDLAEVLIGGGFGNFIRRKNAQRIGLLPPGIERHRIRYLGNTSLAGARLVAISQKARQLADELAQRTEHIDLSTDSDFQATFADAMIFPMH